jgi:Cu+-exporting ATPase
LDKTGTLTEGKPSVARIQLSPSAGLNEDEFLSLVASAEHSSEHPLARAIVRAAEQRNIAPMAAVDFCATPGGGVTAKVQGKDVVVGLPQFLREHGIEEIAQLQPRVKRPEGATIGTLAGAYVGIDGKFAGVIVLMDALKKEASDVVQKLSSEGLSVVLLSGGREESTAETARQLGLTEVKAEVSPAEKRDTVELLKRQGRSVAMAGDGVNDAPALAAADVGIAMSTGTDVAIESSGITLLKGDLRGILRARKLSRATIRNIKQNLLFAFIYNALGIPIAAGVLYPFFGWLLSPMIASAAMSFSSVSVIANALRLRSERL